MKRALVWILGLMATLATTLAFANATAYSVSGTVSVSTGTAASRVVRQGDTLRAGDTVSTGPSSSAVLKFEDGQIAALGANSRMLIQTFEYNAQAKSGNIVLNLLSGGMRAITGLIGKSNPTKVTYRAGNYTIGIRGTDVNIASNAGNVVVTVNDGSITFTVGGQTYTVTAGNGAFMSGTTVNTDTIAAIVNYVQANQPALNTLLQGVSSVPISVPVPGAPGSEGQTTSGTITTTPSGPGGGTGGGGGGPNPPVSGR
ncbi:MAG: FecR domain-containing protein [Betaproteobacteria bacterium]|nr:FecR domain-containing protein [Betaproteobacteria bacterium]